ncbi:MAG: hypothetical protein CMJ39_12170 [Phycisphaerae bacterium]|nr:hypothetical protein [Phycisphaerae bacterium]
MIIASLAILSLGLTSTTASPVIDGKDGLMMNRQIISDLREMNGTILIKDMPLADEGLVELEVTRFTVTSPDTRFVIGKDSESFEPKEMPSLYRGTIAGQPESMVYLAFCESQAWGLIDRRNGDGQLVLGRSGDGSDRDEPILKWQRISGDVQPPLGVPVCGLKELPREVPPRGDLSTPRLLLDLAIETDWEYTELFQGDLDAGAAYVVALYGAIATIYDRDVNLDLNVTWVRLWDTPDDLFNDDDPLQPFRVYWNENMNAVNRDLAQFLTGRTNLPYGGVAWLSATCGDYAYSVAGYIMGSFTSSTDPAFGNWDITVSAHELGHNCGTAHTHDYDLDSCAFGTTQRGSIMSYCHTTTGGGSNIDLRFHRVTTDYMRSHLADAPCLINDCNDNDVDDQIDIAFGTSLDANMDGIPDDCQDCNGNGIIDEIDIALGASNDADADGVPDECEADCNGNGLPDDLDIAAGTSTDLHGNSVPDECETDCDNNGESDYNQIQEDMSLDINRNVILDSCEDCDGNGTPDLEQLEGGSLLWIAGNTEGLAKSFHPYSGVPMASSPAGSLSSSSDLVISPDGRIMAGDRDGDRVIELDPVTGANLGPFITTGDGGLSAPQGMDFGPDGRLFIATGNGVLAFDGETGAFDENFVIPGSGGLSQATGILFLPQGNLLVGTQDGRVLEFNGENGNHIRTVVDDPGRLGGTHGLLLRPGGTLLVTSTASDTIEEYDPITGSHLGRWDRGGLLSGYWGLQEPRTLRLGPDGNVYVATAGGNTSVQLYEEATGLFKRRFYVLDQLIEEATGFDFMPAAAIDCNGNMIPDTCDIANGDATDLDGNGIPDSCVCPGDIDGDGSINVNDILIILAGWGTTEGDITGDQTTDVNDILLALSLWGGC